MWVSVVDAQARTAAAETAAAPRPIVLLLHEPAEPRPGLLASLQIQLGDVAEVRASPELTQGSVGDRIAAAAERSKQDRVLLVVWSDAPLQNQDGSQEAVLYAVGRREGRALLEVVRVAGGEGPEMERSLAIKVREVATELIRAEAEAPGPNALGTQRAAEVSEPDEPRWGGRLGLFALAGPQPGSALGQWGGLLHAGPGWQSGRWRVSGLLGVAWFPTLTAHGGGAAYVELEELAPRLIFAVQHRVDGFWLGAHAGACVSFVDATGHTAQGHRASTDVRLGSWLLGLGAELQLTAALAAALRAELQTRFVHQRFAVNGQTITDLGSVRPLVHAGLVFRLD